MNWGRGNQDSIQARENKGLAWETGKQGDLIDHNILVRKLSDYDIPNHILCWTADFLLARRQRVKLAQDCFSEWRYIPAGVPRGTKLGPWLFLIVINDIDLNAGEADMWKYVDDTTISEVVDKGQESCVEEVVDDLATQTSDDGFQLNKRKCEI